VAGDSAGFSRGEMIHVVVSMNWEHTAKRTSKIVQINN
jgi:hypothetical protein